MNENIRVGSIIFDAHQKERIAIVLRIPSTMVARLVQGGVDDTVDVYWFYKKEVDWEYTSYLKVLVP